MEFAETLGHDDKIAVEMTTNLRLSRDAVWPHVERVDVVNTSQFKVVTESVKKTDKNDAVLLARFLGKDMLSTVYLNTPLRGGVYRIAPRPGRKRERPDGRPCDVAERLNGGIAPNFGIVRRSDRAGALVCPPNGQCY